MPQNYNSAKPIPFILTLHGRGGGSADLETFCEAAAKEGIAVAVPDSRGPDIDFLERVLAYVFERLAVNPHHLAIAGFSDGGSYSLSVGLTNGDLFSLVIAYSRNSFPLPFATANL